MRAFLLLSTVLAVAFALGCGGDDESTEASRAPTRTQPTASVEEPTASVEKAPPAATTTEPKDDAETQATDVAPSSTATAQQPAPEPDSDPAEREAAGNAAREFVEALADGDGDGACAAMADEVRAQVEKSLGQAPAFKGKGCGAILAAVAARYPDRVRESMRDSRVVGVTIDGETARVAYRAGDLPKATVPLVRVDGDWKVGSLAASAQGAG